MPVFTLPDGSQRSYDHPVSAADVAADIGPGLAKAAVAAKLNGRPVDTSTTIREDAELALVASARSIRRRSLPTCRRMR